MPNYEPQAENGVATYRPRGTYSLVETVDLISAAIAACRHRRIGKLLIDVTGIEGVNVPTLIDRFLMVEDWAQAAQGVVVAVLIVDAQYIHPRKFGVKVASHLGLICDVYTSEEEAVQWLQERTPPPIRGPR